MGGGQIIVVSLPGAHRDAIAALFTDRVEKVVDDAPCVVIALYEFRDGGGSHGVAAAILIDVLLQGGAAVVAVCVVDAGAVLEAAVLVGRAERAAAA